MDWWHGTPARLMNARRQNLPRTFNHRTAAHHISRFERCSPLAGYLHRPFPTHLLLHRHRIAFSFISKLFVFLPQSSFRSICTYRKSTSSFTHREDFGVGNRHREFCQREYRKRKKGEALNWVVSINVESTFYKPCVVDKTFLNEMMCFYNWIQELLLWLNWYACCIQRIPCNQCEI